MVNLRCVSCHKIGGKGYFRFPKQSEDSKKWLKELKLAEDLDVKPLRVCFRHFCESDLQIYSKQIRTKDGKFAKYLN